MIKIHFSGKYHQSFKKILKEYLGIKSEINVSIKLFQNDPKDTRLQNHALRKVMKGKYAFSVTDDIRIVYTWVGKSTVRFLDIGTHKQVYRVKSS